jgi:hypothetical protein
LICVEEVIIASKIVVCGQSLFLMAIEAALAALPDTEVVRLDEPTADRLTALAPTLIVSARDPDAALMRTLVNCDLPFIELDTSTSEVRVVNTKRMEVAGIEELVQLIGHLMAGVGHDEVA